MVRSDSNLPVKRDRVDSSSWAVSGSRKSSSSLKVDDRQEFSVFPWREVAVGIARADSKTKVPLVTIGIGRSGLDLLKNRHLLFITARCAILQ
jgi:hypothetical protein